MYIIIHALSSKYVSVHAAPPVTSPLTPHTGAAESAKPKLKHLQEEISKVSNDWQDIGFLLDIEEGQLIQIKSDNAGECNQCLLEVLRIWLSRVDPPPSWSDIAEALEILEHTELATNLRAKYCS